MNRTMTVAQLSSYLSGVFDDEELLHDVTLTGEAVEVSYSDRHTFLTLAEKDCSIRCVHFSSRDPIKKGERLSLKGSVRFYDKRNSVSFCYNEYFVSGAGDRNAKLKELKERLRAEGYFENRPKLPKYITDVVAVTSADGAAIRDLLRVVSDKNPFVKIHVYPVNVQGEGAARMMTDAIKKLQSRRTDAIALCRGGGSDEDLDSFNDEDLAVAVARSKIPVISAIGHEIDYTLCDFCAGTRAGTPSIAGEIINAHASALVDDITTLAFRAERAIDAKLEKRQLRLKKVSDGLSEAMGANISLRVRELMIDAQRSYYAVKQKLDARKSAVRSASCDLALSAERCVQKKRVRIEKLSAVLGALDPTRIIKSGYAAVLKNGKRTVGACGLEKGDAVSLVFADGTAQAEIQRVERK